MSKEEKILKIKGLGFAYDGCHKIYIIETEEDMEQARDNGWDIYEMDKLLEKFNESCGLRFINNWGLDKTFVGQFEFDEEE